MEPASKGPKACTTCAKAKARCIPGPGKDSKCERCQRLKRECVSQQPAPPRAKKPPKRSRVAELEKRLDELSSQFVDGAAAAAINPRSSQQSGDSPSISVSSGNPLSATERPGQYQQQQQQRQQQQQQQQQQRRRRTKCDSIVTFEYLFPSPRSESAEVSGWTSEVGSNDCVMAATDTWPTDAEAETLLLQYHASHAPLAPFVIVPKHLMAADLRRQRPFLWRVVMMISCFIDGPRQHRMGKEVLAELGRMSVLDSTRNLETLQGLLLTISWLNFCLKSAQLTNLLFLARSMSLSSGGFGISYGAGGNSSKDEVKWGELEHARAYLGTYYLNAIVFNTNKKVDAFMNTSQLDNYCNLLTSPGEYHSDLYLARLVKIQTLSQSISMAMLDQQPMQLPLTMVIQTFQEQIDAYRASLPPHLLDNSTLQCHLAISKVLLADMAISDAHCSAISLPHSDRIHLLWSCLHALRRFYAVASIKSCDIADQVERNFLGINASDLAYAIITGIKLLLVRIPDWDPRYIISELGIREMLDKEIEHVGEVVARRKSDRWPEEDPMDRMHKLLMYGRDLVNMQIQQVAAEMEGRDDSSRHALLPASAPATTNKGDTGQGWMMAGMEDLDDDLWQNFMNDTAWNLNGEPMVMDSF